MLFLRHQERDYLDDTRLEWLWQCFSEIDDVRGVQRQFYSSRGLRVCGSVLRGHRLRRLEDFVCIIVPSPFSVFIIAADAI